MISLRTQKASLWTAGGFYGLIAFEFIYMATPFAAFFYSAYRPVLNLENSTPLLSWLNCTFLPHIVQDTTSPILNARQGIGITCVLTGFLGFVICAVQIYANKLFRKSAVVTGLYRYVRHPQYAFLTVWGFGLAVLWPRTIVLLSFVTMIFVYYLLARIEENECERKFGPEYMHYMNNTSMFFPLPALYRQSGSSTPPAGCRRALRLTALYIASLATALVASVILKEWSLKSLYAVYDKNTAYISVTKMESDSLRHIIATALRNSEVCRRLDEYGVGNGSKCINYVLPFDTYMLEIPMNENPSADRFHFMPRNSSPGLSKIIFTKAETESGNDVDGKQLIRLPVRRTPLLEVAVDPVAWKVLEIASPASSAKLIDISLPVF